MLGLIFWLSVLGIGIVFFAVRFRRRGFTVSDLMDQFMFPILIVILVVFLGILFSVMLPSCCTVLGDIEQRQTQIEHEIVWAENAKTISAQERQEFIKEVKEYNEDVRWIKAHRDNFWYGYYVPGEHVELEEVEIPQRLLIEDEQESSE